MPPHPRPAPDPLPRPCLVLYDGACGWCTGWVARLARHDRARQLAFAPLGGATATRFLSGPAPADTLVVLERTGSGVRASVRSEAAFRVLARLGGPWRLLSPLRHLPRGLTDRLYGLMARHRHRLAGAPCPLPRDPDAFLP